jgi:hypothetical protein
MEAATAPMAFLAPRRTRIGGTGPASRFPSFASPPRRIGSGWSSAKAPPSHAGGPALAGALVVLGTKSVKDDDRGLKLKRFWCARSTAAEARCEDDLQQLSYKSPHAGCRACAQSHHHSISREGDARRRRGSQERAKSSFDPVKLACLRGADTAALVAGRLPSAGRISHGPSLPSDDGSGRIKCRDMKWLRRAPRSCVGH